MKRMNLIYTSPPRKADIMIKATLDVPWQEHEATRGTGVGLIVRAGSSKRDGYLIPWSEVAHWALELAKHHPQACADLRAALGDSDCDDDGNADGGAR